MVIGLGNWVLGRIFGRERDRWWLSGEKGVGVGGRGVGKKTWMLVEMLIVQW
jgi:hypothetical protein